MNALLWFLLGGVSFGTVLGLVLHMLLGERIRAQSRRDALLEAAGEARWQRAPFADNGGAVVVRRRSPNVQLVTRPDRESLPRPGLHY